MHSNSPTELTLLGINKKWIRGPKGEWRDKVKLAQAKKQAPDSTELLEEESPKKWWQFWK